MALAVSNHFDVPYDQVKNLHDSGIGFGVIVKVYFFGDKLGIEPTEVILNKPVAIPTMTGHRANLKKAITTTGLAPYPAQVAATAMAIMVRAKAIRAETAKAVMKTVTKAAMPVETAKARVRISNICR